MPSNTKKNSLQIEQKYADALPKQSSFVITHKHAQNIEFFELGETSMSIERFCNVRFAKCQVEICNNRNSFRHDEPFCNIVPALTKEKTKATTTSRTINSNAQAQCQRRIELGVNHSYNRRQHEQRKIKIIGKQNSSFDIKMCFIRF